ncbi:MAG: SPOR domain-containing protein [Rhodanobacteraceae bacterium]|nr:MAG: SPOR domain-containing protein [Rhodanobacteraceae bacterium]
MDSGLKKRLLGAAVLIVLAIIFVPMLLPSHPDNGTQPVSLTVPPEPSGDMQTRILKVGPDGASAGPGTQVAVNDPDHLATVHIQSHPAPSVSVAGSTAPIDSTGAPVASAPAVTPGAAALPPRPSSVPAKAVIAKAGPAAMAKAAPLPGGAGAAAGTLYTVNLGIYADHASAAKLVARAKQHGFTALATPETYQGKSVLRVRVGTFPTRAAAEAARLKLAGFEHVSMMVDATALNQAGDAPASALAAGQPGGWAVQLAAFGTEGAANELRDQLRGQGFDGYVDSVNAASGKLWRVRAGPYASRAVAASTQAQIAQKLKIKGNIVTQN